jgi:hypothetical protein
MTNLEPGREEGSFTYSGILPDLPELVIFALDPKKGWVGVVNFTIGKR